MSRLWSSGSELQSATAGMEFTVTNGTPDIETTTIRSGAAALRISSTDDVNYVFSSADTEDGLYCRFYLYIVALPAATRNVFGFQDAANTLQIALQLTNTGTFIFRNVEDGANIGSASSALNTGQWYRIEVKFDSTTIASTVVEARIDGTTFASGTVDMANGANRLRWLRIAAETTLDFIIDDIALNDDSGSSQNSWPGEGEIIHLRPNATGDNSDWDGTNTYQNIDEITPDDATTIISSQTSGQIQDVNIDATPAALASNDVINVVQVGVRFNTSDATDPDPEFVLRIKASASGTVEEGPTITASSAVYGTNTAANPRNYSLTLYDLPGASTTAWTKADLDTTQIGVKLTNSPTGLAQVSTLWLLVEHTSVSVKDIISQGIIPFAR